MYGRLSALALLALRARADAAMDWFEGNLRIRILDRLHGASESSVAAEVGVAKVTDRGLALWGVLVL